MKNQNLKPGEAFDQLEARDKEQKLIDKGFYQGVAYAIGEIVAHSSVDDYALRSLISCIEHLSARDLAKLEVSAYDRKQIAAVRRYNTKQKVKMA